MAIRLSSIKSEITTISSSSYALNLSVNTLSSNLATVSSSVHAITASPSLSVSGNLIVGGNLSVVGYLQTPAPYHCTLTLSTTSTSSGSDLVVEWTPVSDPNGWYGSGTKRVTPTVDGWYHVYYQAKFDPTTTGAGNQWNIQIVKNGNNTVAIAQNETIDHIGRTLATQALVYFNGSTDYITAQVYSSTATGLATAPGWSRLELFRLN